MAESPVIGMNNFIHATDSLQKTVAFYEEVFGLPTPPPPRPPNPAVPGLVNAPGAQFQVAVFRIPGAMFGWELTNFGPIERKAGQARPTDPGAADSDSAGAESRYGDGGDPESRALLL